MPDLLSQALKRCGIETTDGCHLWSATSAAAIFKCAAIDADTYLVGATFESHKTALKSVPQGDGIAGREDEAFLNQKSSRSKVLITGATGHVGRALTNQLLLDGRSVIGVARKSGPVRDRHLDWVEADLHSAGIDYEVLLAEVDLIYHLAWSTVPYSANLNPISDLEGNVVATMRLAQAAARRGARLVFTSSGGTVYGRLERAVADEAHPTRPTSFYGTAKLVAEQYLDLYRELRGLDCVVLRIANVYGPGQPPGQNFGAVATFADQALREEEITIWGDGEVTRDFIYVTDVVSALVLAGESISPSRPLNIGSGQGRSLNQIMDALRLVLDSPLKVRYVAARSYDVPVSILDVSRAKQELNWSPIVAFEDGVARTLYALKALHLETGSA